MKRVTYKAKLLPLTVDGRIFSWLHRLRGYKRLKCKHDNEISINQLNHFSWLQWVTTMFIEHRVIGPPGCGKTTWLSGQVWKAVDKHGPDCVLIASLTRAAAAEVVGRNLPISRDCVGTLHSHAFRSIGNPKMAQSREMLTLWNSEHPTLALSGGLDLDDGMDALPTLGEGDALMLDYSSLRARMVKDRKTWSIKVRAFATQWEDFKNQTGTIDFTDMIEHALLSTTCAPGNPQFIFCDEAQDLDRMQLALVRRWANGGDVARLIIVGDPDQNLYEWRGTDATSFFEGEIPPENNMVLSQSYRVPTAVHALACKWIRRARSHRDAPYLPRDYPGTVRRLDCPQSYPGAMLKSLEANLAAGKTCMILSACGYMIVPILKILAAEGIPFHNPYRVKRSDWNPLSHTDRVLSYLSTDKEICGEDARMWTWDELHRWSTVVRADGIFTRGAKARIKEMATNRATAKGVVDTAGLFEGDGDNVEVDSLEWLKKNLLPTAPKSIAYICQVGIKHGKARISQKPKVIIGTIHSVKGGEADVVYLFPNISRSAFEQWEAVGSKGYDAIVRQFYVAVTRAREELVICTQWDPLAVSL